MGIKLPIHVEHREHIEVQVEKPENIALINELENKVEDLRDALGKANSDIHLAQQQIVALEAARLAQPRLVSAQEQKPKVEIRYQDKIVEKVVEIDKIVYVPVPDKRRERMIVALLCLFWMLVVMFKH